MTATHQLLRHVLATLAYRTQKAVRGASADFADFRAGKGVRTPHELVCHMTSVLGYARAQLHAESLPTLERCPTWREELERFHSVLADLSAVLQQGAEPRDVSLEAILQGPFSDAMTHVGQLALLRRLSGDPVAPENFLRARIDPDHVGAKQPLPASRGRQEVRPRPSTMRFYLSSYRVGGRGPDLKRLARGRPLAMISNATDHYDPEVVQLRIEDGLEELAAHGVQAEPFDLRDYFDGGDVSAALSAFGGVWVRGGNTFVLRQAMRLSGFDRAIDSLRSEDFLYGGYSAGVAVLAPTLHGLHHVDDPTVVPYPNSSVIWEGLGFLDHLILPHYKSDHPETELIDKDVAYCTEHGIPFRTLRDGEVIIIE
ncbi:MAG: Type 1 glutamine amidotransferase-like domain-containing protein [Gemmatimonadales bacterium]